MSEEYSVQEVAERIRAHFGFMLENGSLVPSSDGPSLAEVSVTLDYDVAYLAEILRGARHADARFLAYAAIRTGLDINWALTGTRNIPQFVPAKETEGGVNRSEMTNEMTEEEGSRGLWGGPTAD